MWGSVLISLISIWLSSFPNTTCRRVFFFFFPCCILACFVKELLTVGVWQHLFCILFDHSHSDRCKVIPDCGFNLHFSDDWWCWAGLLPIFNPVVCFMLTCMGCLYILDINTLFCPVIFKYFFPFHRFVFFIYALYYVEICSLNPSFWKIFIINGCWSLTKAFSASIEMII